ncbi:hypothetical protein [Rhodohalobacter barkolensis]|uniref:Uncharacterized protein n=1 Tax=Rhodohalobacter barkolensis TaxID=2053187 RepID=A0A2N0VFH7_9BACT|nr:hypothetical protein [Rhodohalobacter barkolensis]PKD42898.1 hypothetical protein CWD77_12660 [Rhodohalobacter barkolensis]
MKKLCILSLLLILIGCDKKSNFILDETTVELTEEQSEIIVNSKEFQKFYSLNLEYFDQIKSSFRKGYTIDQLTEAGIRSYNRNDHKLFYEIIFDSHIKGQEFITELQNARTQLYKKFPILNQVEATKNTDFTDSNIRAFFSKVENSAQNTNSFMLNTEPEEDEGDTPVCGSSWQQVKVLACSAGCGVATGGVGAAICGWGCWCMLCTENSGLADMIC